MESFEIETYGLSDIGLVRPNNEDVFLSIPEKRFFAIADGMGGHKAGEVAARETLENLKESLSKKFHLISHQSKNTEELIQDFHDAIIQANQWVYKLGQKHNHYQGMGSTLCCLHVAESSIVYAHVGDSRIYRFRNQKLEQLTNDHSLIRQWESQGDYEKKQKLAASYKNIITKAIGTHANVSPDVSSTTFQKEDLFFLCTDGLTDYVGIEEIEKVLNEGYCVKKTVNTLVEIAKQKGSHDNITVLMIRILPTK